MTAGALAEPTWRPVEPSPPEFQLKTNGVIRLMIIIARTFAINNTNQPGGRQTTAHTGAEKDSPQSATQIRSRNKSKDGGGV